MRNLRLLITTVILVLIMPLEGICQETKYYTAQSPQKPYIPITLFQTMCLIKEGNRKCKEILSALSFDVKDRQWTAKIVDVDKGNEEIISIQILDCTIKSNREYVFHVSDGNNTVSRKKEIPVSAKNKYH